MCQKYISHTHPIRPHIPYIGLPLYRLHPREKATNTRTARKSEVSRSEYFIKINPARANAWQEKSLHYKWRRGSLAPSATFFVPQVAWHSLLGRVYTGASTEIRGVSLLLLLSLISFSFVYVYEAIERKSTDENDGTHLRWRHDDLFVLRYADAAVLLTVMLYYYMYGKPRLTHSLYTVSCVGGTTCG